MTQMFTTYTFRTMMLGAGLVGGVTGLLGCLLYLRRQTLIADVVGHSAVAGLAVSFAVAAGILGIDGRSLAVLMVGATLAGLLAVGLTGYVTRVTPLGSDAAMAVTLSMLFGGGMVLLRWIAHSRLPRRGGLEKFVLGNASALTQADLHTIVAISAVVVLTVALLFRRLAVCLFDPVLAHTLGLSPRLVQSVLVLLVAVGMVVGTKAIGLMLMIGFVMLPAASARQWCRHAHTMALLSTAFGALGGVLGSVLAVHLGKVPTGPVAILVLAVVLLFSLLAAPDRSVLVTWWRQRRQLELLREEVAR